MGAADWRRLIGAAVDEIGRRNHLGPLTLIRSHCFAACVENDDPGEEEARRRRALFASLRELPGFEVEIFSLDHGGRTPASGFDGIETVHPAPGDAAVSVALSVTMMRQALLPATLDLVIALVGRADYLPLLREVRRFGKQVAVLGLEGASAPELTEPADTAGVRDFDVLWLEPLLDRLERGRLRARSPHEEEEVTGAIEVGGDLRGRVKNIIWDRGYGFIAAEDGRDYFFHANALEGGLAFDELQPDLAVVFEVKSGPSRGRAGAASRVRGDAGGDEGEAAEGAATDEGDEEGSEAGTQPGHDEADRHPTEQGAIDG